MSVQNGRAFNEWLRTQLKAKKMSQRQLAQQSGVDHSTISRLVRGDRTPSLGTATKLARGLRELRDETETPHYFGLVAVVDQPPHGARRVRAALGRPAERAAGAPGDGVLPRAAHAPPGRAARTARYHAGRPRRAAARCRRTDARPQLDAGSRPRPPRARRVGAGVLVPPWPSDVWRRRRLGDLRRRARAALGLGRQRRRRCRRR